MNTHDDCMLQTAILEIQLYGEIVSASVRDHLERFNRRLDERLLQYGGTRAAQVLRKRQ